MRKSKKNITKRKINKTKKNKCVVTDEVRYFRSIIKYFKKHKATKKNKTS
jgi:hypothetical protein